MAYLRRTESWNFFSRFTAAALVTSSHPDANSDVLQIASIIYARSHFHGWLEHPCFVIIDNNDNRLTSFSVR